jgi:hypothetical protein
MKSGGTAISYRQSGGTARESMSAYSLPTSIRATGPLPRPAFPKIDRRTTPSPKSARLRMAGGHGTWFN